MAIERKWAAIGSVAVTAPGTIDGVLTLSSTLGIKVKMRGTLAGPSLPNLSVEIKRVDSASLLEVGPVGASIDKRLDVSSYGPFCTLTIPEQSRPTIPLNELQRAEYEEEPTIATRVILVDQYGDPYVASGGGGSSSVTIKDGSTSTLLKVNPDGSVNSVSIAQLVPFGFNEIDLTNSTISGQVVPTTVIYKQSGVTVATLTLVYDTSANLLSVVRA